MIKTLTQILADLPDQQLKLIKPVDSREIAEGAFGFVGNIDPTHNDDNANTNGNGYFDSASRWANTATPSIWECQSGAVGAAIWLKIYPQTSPPPPPPNPSGLASCLFWGETDGTLWADAGKTIPSAPGGPVYWWIDESISGDDFGSLFGGSYVPTLQASIFNGHPGIYFNGGNDLQCSVAATNGATKLTVFLVLKHDPTATNYGLPWAHVQDRLNDWGYITPGLCQFRTWNGEAIQFTSVTWDSPVVIALVYDGSQPSADLQALLYVNGSLVGPTYFTAPLAAALQNQPYNYLGDYSGGEFFKGWMAAAGLFDDALSPTVVGSISAYLSNKYLGTNIPTTQFVGARPPLYAIGPPWAPTIQADTLVAKIYLGAVGSLSGLGTFGAYTLVDGDVVIAGLAVTDATMGLWVAHLGSWTRPAWYPVGQANNGPFCVWVTDFPAGGISFPTMVALTPAYGVSGTPPYAWTIGTDAVTCLALTPVSFVGAGSGISVSQAVLDNNIWTFSVSLASYAPVLGVSLTDPGGVPPTPAPGTVTLYNSGGSLYIVDSSAVVTPVSGGAYPGTGNNIVYATTAVYATVFAFTAPHGLIGGFRVYNLGGQGADLRITVTDILGNSYNTVVSLGAFPSTYAIDLLHDPIGSGLWPYSSITLEAVESVPPFSTNLQVSWTFVAN